MSSTAARSSWTCSRNSCTDCASEVSLGGESACCAAAWVAITGSKSMKAERRNVGEWFNAPSRTEMCIWLSAELPRESAALGRARLQLGGRVLARHRLVRELRLRERQLYAKYRA